MTGYLLTVLCAVVGVFCIAGGALLLWMHPDYTAVAVTTTGVCFYTLAILRTARAQL